MKIYVAFDDTDTLDCGRGTGKLARWFVDKLPAGCKSLGVVRQQLFHDPSVPMTSHNSALCVLVDAPGKEVIPQLIELAAVHIKEHFEPGSDPGLCVAPEDAPEMPQLIEFGIKCTHTKTNQHEAKTAVGNIHLSGHGGTNDGIIGAAACVGLTHLGQSGRFVDYKSIRELPHITTYQDLLDTGIFAFSVNRHAEMIKPNDTIDNEGSLRPRLLHGRVVLPVINTGAGTWKTISEKAVYINHDERE